MIKLVGLICLLAVEGIGQMIPFPGAVNSVSGGGGAITFINSGLYDSSAAVATFATTTTQNLVVGNTNICGIRDGGNATVSSVTDSSGNTYTYATNSRQTNGSTSNTEIWYSNISTAGATVSVTVNITGTTAFNAIICNQYHRSTPFTFDVATSSLTTGSVTTITSQSFTPAGANELLIGMGSQSVGGGTWTAGTGPTYGLRTNSGGVTNVQTEDILGGASGAQTASITYSVTSAMNLSVAAFK